MVVEPDATWFVNRTGRDLPGLLRRELELHPMVSLSEKARGSRQLLNPGFLGLQASSKVISLFQKCVTKRHPFANGPTDRDRNTRCAACAARFTAVYSCTQFLKPAELLASCRVIKPAR